MVACNIALLCSPKILIYNTYRPEANVLRICIVYHGL